MRLFNNSKPKNLSLLSSFVLAFSISTFAQIVVGPGSTTSGGGGGSGTVTQVDTTAPITGGPITTTGTIECATCGITSNPLSQFAATTSAQLAGVISNESGSGLLVFNTTPTFTTSFLLETAGVSFSAADGVLTLLGLGDGNDENLTIDLDNGPADSIIFGSSTDVFSIVFDTGSILGLYVGTSDDSFYAVMERSESEANTSGFTPTSDYELSASTNSAFLDLNGNTSSRLTLNNDGVRLTGNDGTLTFLSLGPSNQESLTIDLNSFSNVIQMSSSSGATRLLFSNISNIDIATAGVRLSGSDGILTLLGLGNGNDENLVIDFDNATANEINFSSSTGVTVLDFGTLTIEATYNSSDGSAGHTGTTCTSFKDGLCVAGT